MRVRLSTLALLMVAAGIDAQAQTSVVGGALEGSITDPSGGLVADAPVRLREVGTHREREAATDAEGDFRVPELNVAS